MSDQPARTLELRIAIGSAEELAALRGALLAARATELGELQRQASRLSHGYGSDSTRESMRTDVERMQLRKTMLDRLIAALEESANSVE